MTQSDFIQLAKFIEVYIQSNPDYKNCIGTGHYSERFNKAYDIAVTDNLLPKISEEQIKHYRKQGYLNAYTKMESFYKLAAKQFEDSYSTRDFKILYNQT